jgi:hypothetical protein
MRWHSARLVGIGSAGEQERTPEGLTNLELSKKVVGSEWRLRSRWLARCRERFGHSSDMDTTF